MSATLPAPASASIGTLVDASRCTQKLQTERDALAARFEDVSRKWMTAPAEDAETDAQRDLLAKELRSQYLALDPYVRGRGAYHRIGNIVGK